MPTNKRKCTSMTLDQIGDLIRRFPGSEFDMRYSGRRATGGGWVLCFRQYDHTDHGKMVFRILGRGADLRGASKELIEKIEKIDQSGEGEKDGSR